MRKIYVAAAAACISMIMGLSAFAIGWIEDESCGRIWYSTNDTDTDWYHDGWQEIDGAWYYFWDDGYVASGLVEDGGHEYLFDADGTQLFGWQMLDDGFAYFNIEKGTEGYRLDSTEKNGIAIDENGLAVETDDSLELLAIVYRANKLVESVTAPYMTREEKLFACFNHMKSGIYGWSSRPEFKDVPGWQRAYANDILVNHTGNCFSYASAFAYMASACGYPKVYIATSGGHAWNEIDGLVYDSDWARVYHNDTYFGMSYDLSGVGGRPKYKQYLSVKLQV